MPSSHFCCIPILAPDGDAETYCRVQAEGEGAGPLEGRGVHRTGGDHVRPRLRVRRYTRETAAPLSERRRRRGWKRSGRLVSPDPGQESASGGVFRPSPAAPLVDCTGKGRGNHRGGKGCVVDTWEIRFSCSRGTGKDLDGAFDAQRRASPARRRASWRPVTFARSNRRSGASTSSGVTRCGGEGASKRARTWGLGPTPPRRHGLSGRSLVSASAVRYPLRGRARTLAATDRRGRGGRSQRIRTG